MVSFFAVRWIIQKYFKGGQFNHKKKRNKNDISTTEQKQILCRFLTWLQTLLNTFLLCWQTTRFGSVGFLLLRTNRPPLHICSKLLFHITTKITKLLSRQKKFIYSLIFYNSSKPVPFASLCICTSNYLSRKSVRKASAQKHVDAFSRTSSKDNPLKEGLWKAQTQGNTDDKVPNKPTAAPCETVWCCCLEAFLSLLSSKFLPASDPTSGRLEQIWASRVFLSDCDTFCTSIFDL